MFLSPTTPTKKYNNNNKMSYKLINLYVVGDRIIIFKIIFSRG